MSLIATAEVWVLEPVEETEELPAWRFGPSDEHDEGYCESCAG